MQLSLCPPLQVEEVSAEVTKQRSKVTFSPRDLDEIVSCMTSDHTHCNTHSHPAEGLGGGEEGEGERSEPIPGDLAEGPPTARGSGAEGIGHGRLCVHV